MREIEGLRGEHTLILDPADTLRIMRSISVITLNYARHINKSVVVPDITLLPSMTSRYLASLFPTHVLYHFDGECILGLGLTMSDGVSSQAG